MYTLAGSECYCGFYCCSWRGWLLLLLPLLFAGLRLTFQSNIRMCFCWLRYVCLLHACGDFCKYLQTHAHAHRIKLCICSCVKLECVYIYMHSGDCTNERIEGRVCRQSNLYDSIAGLRWDYSSTELLRILIECGNTAPAYLYLSNSTASQTWNLCYVFRKHTCKWKRKTIIKIAISYYAIISCVFWHTKASRQITTNNLGLVVDYSASTHMLLHRYIIHIP